jgi:hypothetical protein
MNYLSFVVQLYSSCTIFSPSLGYRLQNTSYYQELKIVQFTSRNFTMATEKMVSLLYARYLEGQCFRIAHFGVMM